MRRRGASFFYDGIVTVKIFCWKYPKLASLSILIIIYSVAYVAYGEELAIVVGDFIQTPFTSIGKYVIITTEEKVLVQTLQKVGISNSTQFNHLLNEKDNLTQKLTAAEKAVEKTAELAQSAHDSNTEFKKILWFVGGAVVLASIFYFLGGASLGNANANLELPPKTTEVAATLSKAEQIAYAANFEKIWGMGEGLFGKFEIEKASFAPVRVFSGSGVFVITTKSKSEKGFVFPVTLDPNTHTSYSLKWDLSILSTISFSVGVNLMAMPRC